jgi:hypothetical protein
MRVRFPPGTLSKKVVLRTRVGSDAEVGESKRCSEPTLASVLANSVSDGLFPPDLINNYHFAIITVLSNYIDNFLDKSIIIKLFNAGRQLL